MQPITRRLRHRSPRAITARVVVPIYLVVAMASLVDNAVGAWSPTLLIRTFGRDPAHVGEQLGLGLTIAFGGGVLLGGWLSDRAGLKGRLALQALGMPGRERAHPAGGRGHRLGIAFAVVMTAVPLYFALSGIVTACGFSAILDVVPNPPARLRHGGQLLLECRARRGHRTLLGRARERSRVRRIRGPRSRDRLRRRRRLRHRGARHHRRRIEARAGGFPAH